MGTFLTKSSWDTRTWRRERRSCFCVLSTSRALPAVSYDIYDIYVHYVKEI